MSLDDLLRAAEDRMFDSLRPSRFELPEVSLEKALSQQIDYAAMARPAGTPERIRLTELVPEGMMLLAPFEKDGSIPGTMRTLTNGPVELLVHPDDWERIVAPFREGASRLAQSGEVVRILAWPHGRNAATTAVPEHTYMGIPVLDDTIKARMERDQ